MSFTFKLDNDVTQSSLSFTTSLQLAKADQPDLSTKVTAVCEYDIAATTLNTSDAPFFKLVYTDGENPASASADDVNYVFNATRVGEAFDDLALWEVMANGSAGAHENVGYANRAPTSMQPASSESRMAHGNDNAGVLGFRESILAKRLWSAYGADVTELLANADAITTDINARVAAAVTNVKAAFNNNAGANKNAGNPGYRMWTQAVGDVSDANDADHALTVRLEKMLKLTTETASNGDAGTATSDGTDITAPFVFAAGDKIEFDVILNPEGTEEDPDMGGADGLSEAQLVYRMRLLVV
tara:strand:+ start:4838 stop:5737 length:900 start_codon:yes stop_codon:yes gene_type:complete